MKMKKGLAIFMAIAMVFCYMPTTAFADVAVETTAEVESAFVDMPEEGFWSTTALKAAVNNGLLNGFIEGGKSYIKGDDSLTRAQMATIVNRAFGAENTATLSGVSDVPANEWYYKDMQKAVKMGTMKLDTLMRPNDSITRQEAFTVLGRALKMSDGVTADFASFNDASQVASWATEGMGAMVKAGYIQGDNNLLTPKATMTRAQFATIMNNLIKQYITTSGTVKEVVAGNVMVNAPGVTLENITITGDLVIGDGVGDGNVTLKNVVVKGDLIARGGGVDSIIITGGSVSGKVIIAKVDGKIRVFAESGAEIEVVEIDDGKDDVIIQGTVGTVEVKAANTPVVMRDANVKKIDVKTEGAGNITVDNKSKVGSVVVGAASTGTKVDVVGTVTSFETSAKDTALSGTGTVTNAKVNKGADNTSVTTPKTKIDNKAAGVTAGGGTEVPADTTATNNDDGSDTTVTTGGTGGTGGTGIATPTISIETVKVSGSPVTPTGILYVIPNAATKNNTSIDVSIDPIANTTFTAAMTIKKGSIELASASSTGIARSFIMALNDTGGVVIGNLPGIITALGSNVQGEYWNGTMLVQKAGASANQAALETAIDDMYAEMNIGETYTVNISLTPNGGSPGVMQFEIKK